METGSLNDRQILFSRDDTVSPLTFFPLKSGSCPCPQIWEGLDSLVVKSATEVTLCAFQGKTSKRHATFPLFPRALILRALCKSNYLQATICSDEAKPQEA